MIEGADNAVKHLHEIHEILMWPSMVLEMAKEDKELLEHWNARAGDVPNITFTDEKYLTLSEMGLE